MEGRGDPQDPGWALVVSDYTLLCTSAQSSWSHCDVAAVQGGLLRVGERS